MIPQNITREHVLLALADIATSGVPSSRQSMDYFVEHEGRRYPPKYVITVANRHANGADLDPREFQAGSGKGGANTYLEKLGFSVVREVDGAASPREQQRVDPAATRALLEDLFPDIAVRSANTTLLADTIERAAAFGERRWGVSLRPGRINLNLGKLLVLGLSQGRVFIGLHPDALSPEQRAAIAAVAEPMEPFRSAPEILCYRVPPEQVASLRPHFEAAFWRYLERAAATAEQTPYSAAHSPGVLEYLAGQAGRPLPEPRYDPRAAAALGTEEDRIFWVSHEQTGESERASGILHATKVDRGRAQQMHHTLLSQLRENDLVVSYADGQIGAIGRVEEAPRDVERRGEETGEPAQPAWEVDVEYFTLTSPIPLAQVRGLLLELEIPNGPIDRNGAIKQGYLWRFSAEGLDVLRRATDQPWPDWATPKVVRSGWVFQANPSKYDVRRAVRERDTIRWLVRQNGSAMRVGDTVFLWESGRAGGVVATGTIISGPADMPDDEPPGAELVRDHSLIERTAPRVEIRLAARFDPPIGRAALLKDPVLAKSNFVRVPVGTNFRMTPEETLALSALAATPSDGEPVRTGSSPGAPGTPRVAPFDAIADALSRDHLLVSDELLSHYLLALQSRRFVLFTGISGTGKTQLALAVAKHFQPRGRAVSLDGLPEDTARIEVAPYMIKHRRFVVPAVFKEVLDVAVGQGAQTVRVRYPEGESELRLRENPAWSQLQVSLRGEVFDWFEEHLEVGDTFFLRAREGSPPELEILVPRDTGAAEPIDNRAVIAVRPDWTDGRGLLGYHNPVTGRYVTTPFLRLLLRAVAEHEHANREGRAAHPFFAILDEMNLARVEHYFADFLSAMESGEPIVLHDEPAIEAGEPETMGDDDVPAVPRTIRVPPNLFVTGTVNIDETTHMFSPKVLDRAFVIELHDVDLAAYGAGASATGFRLPGFVHLSPRAKPSARSWEAFGDVLEGGARKRVIELHDILASDGRHFGFRVANEIADFVLLVTEQAPAGEAAARAGLDLAIVSKVLPKLHGTQAELEGLLGQLFAFALGRGGEAPSDPTRYRVRRGVVIDLEAGGASVAALLPRTLAKLCRMRLRLAQRGFTSFIE